MEVTSTKALPSEFDARAALTVEETARVLGLSRASAYEAVKNRVIPSIKIGRRLVIPRAALEKLLVGN